MRGFEERNKGKYLHGGGYQTYNQAVGAMPNINGFLNLGR